MLTAMSVLTIMAATTTSYPGFGDKGVVAPRHVEAQPRVEMAQDRGPILELTIRCSRGTAILSYSKMERLYCGPRAGCDRSFEAVVARVCQ